MHRRGFLSAATGAALARIVNGAQESRRLKLFLNCDMDGSPGIFTREQAWYWENGARPEVGREACELFTADINAASEAALAAGAAELIVCDTHHGGGNFIQEKLLRDPRITYLYRSVGMEDGKRRWMPGLNETVAGLLLPGHHAKASTEGAFLPHTWNFEWLDFTINGQSVGEIGIEACFAGHWDIPLIHVQGDEAACAETRRQFPTAVTTAVKRGTTDSCTGLTPEAAKRETARGIKQAIESLRAGNASLQAVATDDRDVADENDGCGGEGGATPRCIETGRSHGGGSRRPAMRCREVAVGYRPRYATGSPCSFACPFSGSISSIPRPRLVPC